MNIQINRAEEAQIKLVSFRSKLHHLFAGASDSTLELLDSLSSNEHARSVVELSLNPEFSRSHGSVYQAIANCYGQDEDTRQEILEKQRHIIGSVLPVPSSRSHYLFVTDVTPMPRPDGETVSDRSYVYTGGGQIEVGHQYSILGQIPEQLAPNSWCLPMSLLRVSSDQNKEMVGIEEMVIWVSDETLPFQDKLCVLLADGAYSKRECLYTVWQQKNLVIISRLRNNRVFYHQPEPEEEVRVGHPRWYGTPFRLNKSDSWSEPAETLSFERQNSRGKMERIEAKAWPDMLMRGKRTPKAMLFHQTPFTLVQIIVYRSNGKPKYKNPLWLTVFGQRREELSLREVVDDYFQRPNIEHFNRFGKQNLLLGEFQTSDTFREENWGHLVGLAYHQLYLAQPLVHTLPRPWEKQLSQFKECKPPTPTLVQRDFGRIIQQIGTPVEPPKPRGNSPGRPNGSTKTPRPKKKVIRKTKKRKKRKK